MTFSSLLAASQTQTTFQAIPVLVLLPVFGAIAVALTPNARIGVHKMLATIFTGVTGAISVWLLTAFETNGEFQFISQQTWIKSLGIEWFAGIDGISLFLVVLTGLLFPFVVIAINPKHDHKAYYIWFQLLQTGCMGVFLSLDLFIFFVFFEIVLIPMYFLIGKWGHGNAQYAATKFFLYTMLGSALMLVSIVSLAVLHAQNSDSELTFNLLEIATNPAIATNTSRLLFLGFALAFAVKVPLFPVHTWLPDAHTEAPTAGSVILAGVMLKLGTYGFIRFGLFLFPEASHFFAPLFLTLGVIGIVYGAIVATMQKDLKRLVAYSSIAHLGFIILGTFALNTQGIQGATVQMINHGLSTGALFMLVGSSSTNENYTSDFRTKWYPKISTCTCWCLYTCNAVVNRASGTQWIRRRISDTSWNIYSKQMVGGHSSNRSNSRCTLPTMGVPTRIPRPSKPRR